METLVEELAGDGLAGVLGVAHSVVKVAVTDLLLLILIVVEAALTLATEPEPVPDQFRKV